MTTARREQKAWTCVAVHKASPPKPFERCGEALSNPDDLKSDKQTVSSVVRNDLCLFSTACMVSKCGRRSPWNPIDKIACLGISVYSLQAYEVKMLTAEVVGRTIVEVTGQVDRRTFSTRKLGQDDHRSIPFWVHAGAFQAQPLLHLWDSLLIGCHPFHHTIFFP